MAKSLGYKSHSDLLNITKKNTLADNLLPFAIGDTSKVGASILSFVPSEDLSTINNACKDVNEKELLRHKNLQLSKKLFKKIISKSLSAKNTRDVWEKNSQLLITNIEIILTYLADTKNEFVTVAQIKNMMNSEEACKIATSDVPEIYKQGLFKLLTHFFHGEKTVNDIALHGIGALPNSKQSWEDHYGYMAMVFLPAIHELT